MGIYTTYAKNAMLDGSYTPATHVAAFQGDPTGAGVELDRQAIAWAAAAGGEKEQSAAPIFDIGAGETVNHVGYFDAGAGGNLLWWDAVTPEVFAGAGTCRLNTSLHHLNHLNP